MRYRLYEGTAGLAEAKSGWEALEPRSSAHPFQRHEFARSWCATIGRTVGASPLAVALEQDGRIAGLFPACTVQHGPIRLLTWIGGPDRVDYGDILYDPTIAQIPAEEFVRDSLRLIRRHAPRTLTFLTNVREDALAYAGLSAELRDVKHSSAPYVPTIGPFDTFIKELPKRQRGNLRRNLKRMEARGSLSLRWLDRGDTGIPDAVDRLLALNRDRFARIGAETNLFQPGNREFLRACATSDPAFAVAELMCGDKVAAIGLVCTYRGRMYFLHTAFEPDFAACSPGRVLTYWLLRQCFDARLEALDLGWGNEAWKYEWTDREMPLVTFVDRSLGGWALATAADARRRLVGSASRATTTPWTL